MKLQKKAAGARVFSLPPFLEKAWDRCWDVPAIIGIAPLTLIYNFV